METDMIKWPPILEKGGLQPQVSRGEGGAAATNVSCHGSAAVHYQQRDGWI